MMIFVNNACDCVVSANGDAYFPGCQDAGHEETHLLLVVVPNGICPVFLVLLAFVHFLQ